ncbi:acetyl-CoA C-acetyltransferase [Helicobacter muridarum]|uniref:Acetyl-CoA C-acetyltransferase n=1 Tax=Helicobacter muridarum TaxID=216 RepID=A0A099U020_9HELI|nr:acetyl-CoA C-acetyltransferase [Helicobacter muridarum]TLE00577.1 acetyl-CoA C-acetyltransferase [Helicobacter muridarum]STQ85589.1 acetyl-CoA acetyltransferase 2 [Helicobacter muridarum]
MKKVVIVSAKRSAIGSLGGTLKDVNACQLATKVLSATIQAVNLDKSLVDEVILGNVISAGLGQNLARQIGLYAGLREDSTGSCVNYVCGSSLKALMFAYQSVTLGESEVVVAGGVESMSNAPYIVRNARFGIRMGNTEFIDSNLSDGLTCAINHYHMGITAENLADSYNISRQEQDEFSLASQQKAAKARNDGRFKDEIVPIEVQNKKTTNIFDADEFIKENTTKEKLAALKPAFKQGGSVTAGNAPGVNDGAAMLLLMSEENAKKFGLKILASIESFGVAGVDPAVVGLGPIKATQKALKKAKLSIKDIDLIESNEAFAAQNIAVARELGFDYSKLNVNGGAIALGHPIGASGARIVVTLLHEMIKRNSKYGLATLCAGGGAGITAIFKRDNT